MSRLTNETIDAWWSQAEVEGNEQVLRLIEEIDCLKKSLAASTRKAAFRQKQLKNQGLWSERANQKRFLQGQSLIRDRIVLALLDAEKVEAASIAKDVWCERVEPEDLKPTLTKVKNRMDEVEPILKNEWIRRNSAVKACSSGG